MLAASLVLLDERPAIPAARADPGDAAPDRIRAVPVRLTAAGQHGAPEPEPPRCGLGLERAEERLVQGVRREDHDHSGALRDEFGVHEPAIGRPQVQQMPSYWSRTSRSAAAHTLEPGGRSAVRLFVASPPQHSGGGGDLGGVEPDETHPRRLEIGNDGVRCRHAGAQRVAVVDALDRHLERVRRDAGHRLAGSRRGAGGAVSAASRGTNHQIAIATAASNRMPMPARLITLEA